MLPAFAFLLVASHWLPASQAQALRYEIVSGPGAAGPTLAVLDDGATLLAWEESSASEKWIAFRRLEPALSSAPPADPTPLRLDTAPAGARALEPRLTTYGSRTVLAWQDNRSGHDDIFVRSSSDGGKTWSLPEVRLDLPSGNSSTSSMISIVFVDSLHVVAAWEDQRSGRRAIDFRASTDGGMTWGAEAVRLDPEGDSSVHGASFHPQIVVPSTQQVLVSWWNEQSGFSDIYIHTAGDGGKTPLRLDPGAPGEFASRDVAFAARGSTVAIAWEDEISGVEREVLARASTDGGANWGPLIRTGRPRWAREVDDPRLAIGRAGRVHLFWTTEPRDESPRIVTENSDALTEARLALAPSPTLFHAAFDPSQAESAGGGRVLAEDLAIVPTPVPGAAPSSHLAFAGATDEVAWSAWAGTRVNPGGVEAAFSVDGGRTWRSVGLSQVQNPSAEFVRLSSLRGFVDRASALHLVWVQGGDGRGRVAYAAVPFPLASKSGPE